MYKICFSSSSDSEERENCITHSLYEVRNYYDSLLHIHTSLSDVPQSPHDLHSMHCHGYFFTEIIIFGVNCRQEG